MAALSVCLFHFANTSYLQYENINFIPSGNRYVHAVFFLPSTDLIRGFSSFGRLGVEVFFVISGFLIPYSLFLRSYNLRDFSSFIIRRLKRLEPPYFACIFLILFLNFFKSRLPGFEGKPISATLPQILAHLAYLNAILKYQWVNPVFWTLGIEFQYYFFAALVFPLLNHEKEKVRIYGLMSVSFLGLFIYSDGDLLPHWLPLFAIGMAFFQVFVGNLKRNQFLFLLPVLVSISIFIVGFQETVVGIITGMVILLLGSKKIPKLFTPLVFAGTLSYSIYLLHIPIGEAFIQWAAKLPISPFYQYPILACAFLLTISSAYILWRLVEKPAQNWAKATSSKSKTDSVNEKNLIQ